MILVIIALLSCASFYFGLKSVLQGFYKPNVYSRLIWFFITINTFIGVIRLDSYIGVQILSGLQMVGGLLMLGASLKYSIFEFVKTEKIASSLLASSLLIWFIAEAPILNVAISLIAHFIGGLPTISRVVKKPKSEYTSFWTYFALGSMISFLFADHDNIKSLVYPLYFAVFNFLIIVLSLRKNFSFKRIWL